MSSTNLTMHHEAILDTNYSNIKYIFTNVAINNVKYKFLMHHLDITVFKISAGPRTLTSKIWVGPASFPSLSYITFGKIVLRSGKFQILF